MKISMLYQIKTIISVVNTVFLSFLFHLIFFSPFSFIFLRATFIRAMVVVAVVFLTSGLIKPRTCFVSRICQGTVLGTQIILLVVIKT